MKKLLYFIFPFVISGLFAYTPMKKEYSQERDIQTEFKNVFMNSQGKQFTIFNTTPTLNQLQNGQIVIVSSTNKGIAWRDGNTVNFLTSSGVLNTFNYVTYTSNTFISNGVSQLIAGANVSLNPPAGTGVVTVSMNIGDFVSHIIAGTGISITPPGGNSDVTVNVNFGSTNSWTAEQNFSSITINGGQNSGLRITGTGGRAGIKLDYADQGENSIFLNDLGQTYIGNDTDRKVIFNQDNLEVMRLTSGEFAGIRGQLQVTGNLIENGKGNFNSDVFISSLTVYKTVASTGGFYGGDFHGGKFYGDGSNITGMNGWNSGYLWVNVAGNLQPSLVAFANDPFFDYDIQGNIMPKISPPFQFDSDGSVATK